MAKFLRYTGEFLSRAGVVWRVEILQEADEAFAPIGSLDFESDEALVIEWSHAEKEEVICGSTAALQIISPGDRTYEDLYTIAPGRIRLDVYRENQLYWSGTLDPEFYEEPYESAAGYTVKLTFSDFGVLDRLKYDLSGTRTLHDIVSYCLGRAAVNTVIDQSLISTSLTASGSKMALSDLKVRSDNFYDEDGEASTLEEVLEGVLQPLALRMVQRHGRVYIYDLNALYNTARAERVEWDGATQTMGTDRVYNNVKITWNTYAQSGVLSPKECWTKDSRVEAPDAKAALQTARGVDRADGGKLYSYHYSTNMDDWYDYTDVGFALLTHTEGKGAVLNDSNLRFFKIVPLEDGTESEGIAIRWISIHGYKESNQKGITKIVHGATLTTGKSGQLTGGNLFTSLPVSIPPVSEPGRLRVRVSINMLMDPRYNPFEEAANFMNDHKNKDWYNSYKTYGNFVYVPVVIKFQSDGGDGLYVWTNEQVVGRNYEQPVKSLEETMGTWVPFTGSPASPRESGFLCWYDVEDRSDTSGVTGWKKNRPAINPHIEKMTTALTNAEEGQYIPYPNYGGAGGKLWIEVRNGPWIVRNEKWNLTNDATKKENSVTEHMEWVLMELPEISIQNNDQWSAEISTDDVEYTAEINAEAKEDIEIDTICGSSAEGVPTARGAYFSASDNRQITRLTRAGRTTQVEDLLIGTLFSQFGERHTKLSGEMKIAVGPLSTFTEANQEGKKFMITSDTQDVISDTSDATITELRPDEYKKRED